MPVYMPTFLLPTNGAKFYLLEDTYVRGGLRIVANEAERLGTHMSSRKIGMLALQVDTGTIWQLKTLTRWAEFKTKTDYFPFHPHEQAEPDTVWRIAHGKGNSFITYTVFDSEGEQVYPDRALIVSEDEVELHFLMPISGHATLTFAVRN